MRALVILGCVFFVPHAYGMEDLFGIKQISYQNEFRHYVQEYRMGNIFVSQTTDTQGNILKHTGKILRENSGEHLLESETAQSTFAKILYLLEAEKQLLAKKAERTNQILGVKG